MTVVPTYEEFQALQLKVDALESMIRQMMAVKVAVEWVRVETAEIILGCSRTTIWRLLKSNELSMQKSGRKVMIGLSSIREYLKKRRYEPEAIETRINSLLAM